MHSTIRPALEPEEWKQRRSGPISLDAIGTFDYVVIEGESGETVTLTGADEIFALISLANDALPNDDPRKITQGWLARVEAIRDLITDLADKSDPKLAPLRRQLADGWEQMAQVLRAILPPTDRELPLDDDDDEQVEGQIAD